MTVKPAMNRLKVVLTVALLGLLLAYVADLEAVGRTLAGIDPLWGLAAFAVMTADRLLMAYKWGLLLRSRGHRLALSDNMRIYCTAMMWGLFLPMTVGADAVRVYLSTRRRLPAGEVIASVAVERMVGFVISLAVGIAALLLLEWGGYLDQRFEGVGWAAAALLLAAALALAASFSERSYRLVRGLLPRRLREGRLVARLDDLHRAYRGYGASRGHIALFSLLTVLEQFLFILFTWLVAVALGVGVGFWFLAGVFPLAILVARLPVSVSGIGVFEGMFVLLMSLGGVAPAESLAIALAGRLLEVAVWLPWWLAEGLGRAPLPSTEDPR